MSRYRARKRWNWSDRTGYRFVAERLEERYLLAITAAFDAETGQLSVDVDGPDEVVMTAGGAMNLLRAELQQEAMAALGYPDYLMTILGVAKILGIRVTEPQ